MSRTGGAARHDEGRHRPPPAEGAGGWCEVFTWEVQPAPPQPAATIRLVLHPGRAWYLAAVVVPGQPLTVVTDLDVPLPSSASSLEVRTTGLWADHNVETPFAHVSLGLEAFGVALDDPADALADGFGVRTPVGFDLEWEDDRPPVTGLDVDRYEVPGRAHGQILLGTGSFEVDGPGQREHAWGAVDWWGPGWWRASIRWEDGRHTVARGPGPAAAIGGRPPDRGPGVASAAGSGVTIGAGRGGGAHQPAAIELRWDDWGLPVAATLRLGDTVSVLEPEACVPVPLAGGPVGGSALLSTLVACRHRPGGDPAGRGWLEIVGPLP
jgi:hypothetical protein